MNLEGVWLKDWRATFWRSFLTKRLIDFMVVFGVLWFFRGPYDAPIKDTLWIALAGLLAIGVLISVRDAVAVWLLMSTGQDEKRASLTFLEVLRKVEPDTRQISSASLAGVQGLIDEHTTEDADKRVRLAYLMGAAEAHIQRLPWFRRFLARDLMDQAVLRYAQEQRAIKD